MEAIVDNDCKNIDESESILETEELKAQFADLLLNVGSQFDFQFVEEEKYAVSSLAVAHDKDESFELDLIIKDEVKKQKKKPKVSGEIPNRIMMFDAAEQQKLMEMKLMNQKSFTFPSSVSGSSKFSTSESNGGKLQADNPGESLESEICVSHSPDIKSSLLMDSSSLPGKSALRGSCKELGLKPRPKLSVKWAPDVYEPPQRSVSHTVNHNYLWYCQKKEGHKKGKNCHMNTHKKHEKKHMYKSRCSSDPSKLRMKAIYRHVGHKGGQFLERQPIYVSVPIDEEIAALSPLSIPQKVSSPSSHGWDYSCPVVTCGAELERPFGMKLDRHHIACPEAASNTDSPLFHSQCFGSFHNLGYKLMYGEAV